MQPTHGRDVASARRSSRAPGFRAAEAAARLPCFRRMHWPWISKVSSSIAGGHEGNRCDALLCGSPNSPRRAAGKIRLKLLKIGALVRTSFRRIKFAMASGCPYERDFALAHAQLINVARRAGEAGTSLAILDPTIAAPPLRPSGLAEVCSPTLLKWQRAAVKTRRAIAQRAT